VVKSLAFEAALTSAHGSVTDFLEQLVGEPINAHVRGHVLTTAGLSNGLRVDEGHPLLFRAATLKGRVSGDSYLYAESAMVLSRLPDRFRLRLESGSDPIGRILSEEGIAVTREALEGPGLPAIAIPSGVTMSAADDILTRTYRVDIDGIPAMAIAEWFLTSLTRFLPAQGD